VSLLGRLENVRAVPALIGALKSPNSNVRENAAIALGSIGDSQALPALITTLTTVARDIEQLNVIDAILDLADEQTASLLIEALHDAISSASRTVGDSAAAIPLVDLLVDKSEQVSSAAGQALRLCSSITSILIALGELALVPLVAALHDPVREVRSVAAQALNPSESLASQVELLHDQHVQHPAIEALDRLDEADIERLVAATYHDDVVRQAALTLLRKLGHPAAKGAIPDAEEADEANVQIPSRSLAALLADLTSSDVAIRAQAARELGVLGDQQAVPALIWRWPTLSPRYVRTLYLRSGSPARVRWCRQSPGC
jgi:HEAT repeat protein